MYNRTEILLNKKMISKNIIDYLIFIGGGGIFHRFHLPLKLKKKSLDIQHEMKFGAYICMKVGPCTLCVHVYRVFYYHRANTDGDKIKR